MRTTHCLKCNKSIPLNIIVDGKQRNLQKRKYCLECSPFGLHNTSKLHVPESDRIKSSRNYANLSEEDKYKLYEYQRDRRFVRKKFLVEKHGGKCCECGYNKNISVLCFHHVNPEEKSFNLDMRTMYAKSIETLIAESNKCKLMCLNCHGELHNPRSDNWNVE